MSCILEMLVAWILIISFYSRCLGAVNDDLKCREVDEWTGCKCVFPTGLGIDLSPLNQENTWFNTSWGDATFYFHPCSDLPLGNHSGENDCSKGASACLFNKTTHTFHNLGSSLNTSFFSTGVTEFPILYYSHRNISTGIGLKCAFVNKSALIYINTHNKNVTHLFELQSRWTCPVEILTGTNRTSALISSGGGLSTGSILVIIFFTFLLFYFVGGAVALKFIRGAEGKEMIPNYDFWVDLPNLVKDGTTFVFSGCQTTPSYDRI